MNKFICIFKLELKDSGMKRKEQRLLERAERNESCEDEPADQQADGLEDEFDREFWIKVSNFYDFLNNFFKNLKYSEFELCDIDMR